MKTKLYLWYISLPGRNVYWRGMGMNSHFLDATYRTTKYALPLFSLLQTITGYSVVGTFVVERRMLSQLQKQLQY